MSTPVVPVVAPGALLTRCNPLACLGASVVVLLGLVLTVDPVTPGIVLAGELIALPRVGVRLGTVLRRSWFLLAAAAGVAVSNLLFAPRGDAPVLVTIGPFAATTVSLAAAAGITLRLLAVGLPGVVLGVTLDPRALADALSQQLHAPVAFTFSALAALRMVPLLGDDWRTLMMARRSRGVAGGGPLARVRLAGQALFVLLVSAIRRGTRLALAMDARAFDSGIPRTWAHASRFHTRDRWLLAGTVLLVAAAGTVSVATGQWRWLGA